MVRLFRGINFDGAAENTNNKLTSLLAFTVKTLRVAGLPELLNIKWMPGCTPWNFNDVHSIHVLSPAVWLKETSASILLTPNVATANNYVCEAGGSHSGITEWLGLLGCHSASFCEWLPTFRRNLLALTVSYQLRLRRAWFQVPPRCRVLWYSGIFCGCWTLEDGTDV